MRSLYFRIFSASFFITFLSPGIAMWISIHVPFSLPRIMMTGLLLLLLLLLLSFHPYSLIYSSLAESQKSTCLTEQPLLVHCSAKNLPTMRHVLLTFTVFCIRIYRAGRRVISRFKLSCNLFVVIPAVDRTSGTI
jgi:hypothetical protein